MAERMSDKKKIIVFISVITAILVIVLIILLLVSWDQLFSSSGNKPAISLEMIENTEKDPQTGLYRVIVKATISGDPEPTVQFNRNDGIGSLPDGTALILLEAEQRFELSAIASNDHGTAEATLEVYAKIDAETDPQTAQEEQEHEPEEELLEDIDAEEGTRNEPPVIDTVFMGPENITEQIRRAEPVVIPFEEARYDFNIIANDPEGENIAFDLSASHGRIVDIGRMAVDQVAFTWLCPDNSEGLIEGIDVHIYLTASDASGASHSLDVPIVLIIPPVAEEEEEQVFEITADSGLSGFVGSDGETRTGVVMVGDNHVDIQLKGYLTFDLETFPDVTGEDIIGTIISFEHVNESGHPENIGNFVDLKAFDYGNSLDRDDFAVGGRRFSMISTEFFGSGVTAQSSLITEVRRVIDAGGDRLQIKIGLNGTTDGNGLWDIFEFNPGNVILKITYME